MTVTVTLHLWWLAAYLGLGLLLFHPLNVIAERQLVGPRHSVWGHYRRLGLRRFLVRFAVGVVAWPLAIWELVR